MPTWTVVRRTFAVAVIAAAGALAAGGAEPRRSPGAFSAEDVAFFDKEVRPILTQRCLKCRGDDRSESRGSFEGRRRHAGSPAVLGVSANSAAAGAGGVAARK